MYAVDPLVVDTDDIAELTPAFTIIDDRPKHDPNRRLDGTSQRRYP
jgi:hypothetical protein